MKTSMKTSMKTTMKFFAALAIMMGFTMGAMAQQSDNSSIAGKASVAAQVSVAGAGAGGSNLDFKNVTPGVAKTIGFSENVTAGTATGSETSGHFIIGKGANTQVTLAFTALPTTLAGTGDISASSLPIAYTAQLSSGLSVTAIGVVTSASTIVVSNALASFFYAASSFSLDLGGTVTPATNQAAGDYESTITLTATYN